jgi:Ser/Thr protein kinase RdoA (MazF antagonist)
MPDIHYSLHPVLAVYPANCQPHAVTRVVKSDGFSDSQIWRLETPRGSLCLRKWPLEHPGPIQLRYIHGVLAAVAKAGFTLCPVPVTTTAGDSFVSHDGHFWEIAPWMPGEPAVLKGLDDARTRACIDAALTALAQFHRAVAQNATDDLRQDRPTGILKRLAQLSALQARGLKELSRQIGIRREIWPELADRSANLLHAFRAASPAVMESLLQAAQLEVEIRPCSRDIHRDHVLFEGNRVSGLIDFGAMQPDNPACDVARLLGSMAGDRIDFWEVGLAAFQGVQPLSEAERRLVRVYDKSGVLLSGINWLRWVFVEQRSFENRTTVLARFDEIAARLRHLNDRQNLTGRLI